MDALVVTPLDAGGPPVFEQPWQAQCFATTLQLTRNGVFSPAEWAGVFGDVIRMQADRPGDDSNETYYRQWLAALETMLVSRGHCTTEQITEMQVLWRQAFLNTPHGQPVALENASADPAPSLAHSHHHDTHGQHQVTPKPVAVSPATKRLDDNPVVVC